MRAHTATLGTILALIGWCIPISAQLWEDLKAQTPQEIADGQTDFWARTLDLSAQQRAELKQVNRRHSPATSSEARANRPDAQTRAALTAIDAQKSGEILRILTSEQRSRYLALRQSMKDLERDHSK